MKFFQETTKWSEGKVPNHIYLLDDSKSKMIAYVKAGTRAVFKFKKPLPFSTRGRTFVAVKNTFGFKIQEPVTENPRWTVVGSKGDKYIVEKTETSYTCTCSGFKFRGACKHIKEIEGK